MRKTVSLAKQNLILECDEEESAIINQATDMLNEAINKHINQISHYDKVILMSALELIVECLKNIEKLQSDCTSYQENLNQYQQMSQSLNALLSQIVVPKKTNTSE